VGAPLGNQNNRKTRIWSLAIAQALDRRFNIVERKAAIDALADVLLDLCFKGDLEALKEFGTRMEGKAVQCVELGDGTNTPVGIAVVYGKRANDESDVRPPAH